MARPLRIEYPGAMYHAISRGNEKCNIFVCDKDRRKFLTYLEKAFLRFNIHIHAYCLMNNHYHLFLETTQANLCKCMQFINSSYTTYFNKKCERVGHLFQGRYKAFLVDKDSYLVLLGAYIHLNPVRSGIVKLPEEYPWSSYQYFVGLRKPPKFLNTNLTLSYFDEKIERYRNFVEKHIQVDMQKLLRIKANSILGNSQFVQKIKQKYLDLNKKTRDLPSLRHFKKDAIAYEKISYVVRENMEMSQKQKLNISVYLLRRYTDNTLTEIAQKLLTQLSTSAIYNIIRRIETKRSLDKQFDKEINDIEVKLCNGEV